METFFVNTLWKDHVVSQGSKEHYFIVDGTRKFRVANVADGHKLRFNTDTTYAYYGGTAEGDNRLPLWLLGFLY